MPFSSSCAQTLSWRWPEVISRAKGPAAAVTGQVKLGGQTSAGPTEGLTVRFVVQWMHPPFSTGGGGVLVRSHDGGIDLDEPVDVASRIGLGLDLLEGLGEDTAQRIAADVGADGLPRP